MLVSLQKLVIIALFIVGCCSATLLTIDKVMAQGSEIHIENNDGEKKIKSGIKY
jgi:S1-C subfamily serine protease